MSLAQVYQNLAALYGEPLLTRAMEAIGLQEDAAGGYGWTPVDRLHKIEKWLLREVTSADGLVTAVIVAAKNVVEFPGSEMALEHLRDALRVYDRNRDLGPVSAIPEEALGDAGDAESILRNEA